MITKYALLFLFAITFISCQKQNPGQPVPKPVIPPGPTNGKLKDMIVNRLPSPLYHFEYDDSGYVKKAAFADGLSIYDVSHVGKKIVGMLTNKDIITGTGDKLEYKCFDSLLTVISVTKKNGILYKRCFLKFSFTKQLEYLQWDVNRDNKGFAAETSMELEYYADGNLKKIRYSEFPADSQQIIVYEDNYEDYDDKLNADGFSLLHTNPFNQFFVLLPLSSEHLQLNNPRRVTRTGDGLNYRINYSYTYDSNGRPVTKKGDFVNTNGADAGKHTDLLTTFVYYD